MAKDINEILAKLEKEKFDDKSPEWRKGGKWCDIEVSVTSDKDNWYYNSGKMIYAQAKQGEDNQKPYCFDCNSKIELVEQKCSVHYRDMPLTGGGEVRTKIIPYCPKCESKPSESGFITE